LCSPEPSVHYGGLGKSFQLVCSLEAQPIIAGFGIGFQLVPRDTAGVGVRLRGFPWLNRLR
jgi:hypothetical protein